MWPKRSCAAEASGGQPLVPASPDGHWKTINQVAGSNAVGFLAPPVLDGRMNQAIFTADVRQIPVNEPHSGDLLLLATSRPTECLCCMGHAGYA